MNKRVTMLAAGLTLAAGLALSGCSSSGGGSDDAASDKPAASASSDPTKGMTPQQKQIFLKALGMAGAKPDGVSDADLTAAGDQVCQDQAAGKNKDEIVSGVEAKLKVDKAKATALVAAAETTCTQ